MVVVTHTSFLLLIGKQRRIVTSLKKCWVKSEYKAYQLYIVTIPFLSPPTENSAEVLSIMYWAADIYRTFHPTEYTSSAHETVLKIYYVLGHKNKSWDIHKIAVVEIRHVDLLLHCLLIWAKLNFQSQRQIKLHIRHVYNPATLKIEARESEAYDF